MGLQSTICLIKIIGGSAINNLFNKIIGESAINNLFNKIIGESAINNLFNKKLQVSLLSTPLLHKMISYSSDRTIAHVYYNNNN